MIAITAIITVTIVISYHFSDGNVANSGDDSGGDSVSGVDSDNRCDNADNNDGNDSVKYC